MEINEYSEELNLGSHWLILKRQWLPAVAIFSLISVLSVLSTQFKTITYKAQGKLLFKSSRAPSLVGVGEGIGELKSLAFGASPLDTQAEIVRSIPVVQDVITTLNLKNEDGQPLAPQIIAKSLQVSNVTDTDILIVSYASPDSKLAAKVVNQVMASYIEYNIQANREEAASAREFIAWELPKTEAAVEEAERALQIFKERYQIVELAQEASAVVDILKTLNREIATAESQLADVTAQTLELSNELGLTRSEGIQASTIGQIPGIQDVLAELQMVQNQLAIEQTRYRPGHPAITALKHQETALKTLIQERVFPITGSTESINPNYLQFSEIQQNLTEQLVQLDIQRLGLEQHLVKLTQTRNSYKTTASVFPNLERQQGQLERRLLAAQSTHEALLIRLQEIQVAANQNVGNARIIEQALVPLQPVASRAKLIATAGILCGILLGIAVAYLLDILDHSIKTVQDTQKLLGYPLLGLIPDHPKQHYLKIPTVEALMPPASRAYEMLQANLKLMGTGQAPRVLTITSTTPKEPSDSIAANLAVSMAQNNQKILLIDVNFSHPSQHILWNIPNKVGLSELIQEKSTLVDAIKYVLPNLSVLTIGHSNFQTIAVLDTNPILNILKHVEQAYDWIILSAPALSDQGDAILLGQLFSSILLVVDPRKAKTENLQSIKQMFNLSNQAVLGFVAVGVEEQSQDKTQLIMTPWSTQHLENPTKREPINS